MATRDEIIAQAQARKGVPYGLPPGPNELDCSLYVLQDYASSGAPFPEGVRTAEQIRQASVPIAFADVLPGDLLFFEHTYEPSEPPGPDGHVASHIGISLGAGTHQMWNAVEPRVKLVNIGTDYWQSHILEARRAPMATTLPTGIDISNNNGAVNLAAVAQAGHRFMFAKATEGVAFRDRFFADNWASAKANGLYRGAYHFARPSVNGPEDEAAFFVAIVSEQGIGPGDMLALDLEDPAASGALNDWTLRFLERVETLAGFAPLVYTSPGYVADHALSQSPEIGRFPLWCASWGVSTPPQAPPPWDLVSFHQYAVGAAGSVPGVSGECDLNRFNGAADRIPLLGKPGTTPTPTPPPSVWTVPSGVFAGMTGEQLQATAEGLVSQIGYVRGDVAGAAQALADTLKKIGV